MKVYWVRMSIAWMTKYEGLLGENVNLGEVRVHQGAKVDAAEASGLQGLTDGKNVAISSRAQRGTLEHELSHVAQQQKQEFNLTEGTRGGYEQDADRIAAKLMSGSRVEGFEESTRFSSSPLQAKKSAEMQAKCKKCEKEDKKLQSRSQPELENNKFLSLEQVIEKAQLNVERFYAAIEGAKEFYSQIAHIPPEEFPDGQTFLDCLVQKRGNLPVLSEELRNGIAFFVYPALIVAGVPSGGITWIPGLICTGLVLFWYAGGYIKDALECFFKTTGRQDDGYVDLSGAFSP